MKQEKEEISLREKKFILFIQSVQIEKVVKKLSEQIYYRYQERIPIFIGVLNGVVIFFSDFLKKYPGKCEIGFIQLASYYSQLSSSGTVNIISNWPIDLTDREVVIFEDIIDTGTTLKRIYDMIQDRKVKSIQVVTLFLKTEVYHSHLTIDYIGMTIPNRFIIGYGLDFDGLGRNLPSVYQLKE